jgi:hypothetical protein
MTQYRISQQNNKFFVQQRGWLPFWVDAFWQRFDTEEEAQGLLQIFERDEARVLSPNKKKSRAIVTLHIRHLSRKTNFLENFPGVRSIREIHKYIDAKKELNRVLGIYKKLLVRS